MILCVIGKNSVALHPFLNSLPKAIIHWILAGNYELSCMSNICLYCLRLVLGEESLMDTDQTVDSPRSHSTGNKQRRFKGGGSLLTPWAVSGDSGASDSEGVKENIQVLTNLFAFPLQCCLFGLYI